MMSIFPENLSNHSNLALPDHLSNANGLPVVHQPWCDDHIPADIGFPGQCCSKPIDVAPHAAVWLTQTDQGTRVIVDGPPSGLDLSIDEAYELHDAILQLREAARDHKPVRL